MQKKFVTNLFILLFLNLMIKPFWILIIEPGVQDRVGNEAYGEYYALFNFSFLLNILLDFGITNFNNKNIAQNSHLLTKHFSSLFVLKLSLAFLYILVTVIVGLCIGYDTRLTKLLLILGFNQFLISMVLYLRSNLLGLHLFKTDAIVSVIDRVIMIALVGGMLWTNVLGDGKIDIMWFVYAQTVGYLVATATAFFIVVSKAEFLKLKWNLPFSIMILKKSFPFAILVLLMTFYNRIDSVMLERIMPDKQPGIEAKYIELKSQLEKNPENLDLKNETAKYEKMSLHNGADQSGIYAKAYRLLDAVNMIAYLFLVLLLPMFSRMLKYEESVEQLVKLAFTLLMTASIIIGAGCVFYSREIMQLLYHEHIEQSASVFAILMCCFTAISTTYVFGTLLTANGNLRELNMMAGGGMIINILLNIILIRVFDLEALGAAISSFTTQFLTAIAQVLIVQNKFKFRINYRLITTLAVYLVGVVAINLVCHTYITYPGKFGWVIGFVIMCALSGAWAFATRLISIKGIFRIMKYG